MADSPNTRLSEREVVALADAFADRTEARALLEESGLPPRYHPFSAPDSHAFWNEVATLVSQGALADGRRRILAEAARRYPGSEVFTAGAGQTNLDRDRDRDRARAEGGRRDPDSTAAPGAGASDGELAAGTIIAVDWERRELRDGSQVELRADVRQMWDGALSAAGIPPERIRTDDRGDGFLTLVDEGVPTARLVADALSGLRARLWDRNRLHADGQRIRMRAAAVQGFGLDMSRGGAAFVAAARMLDSPQLRRALDSHRETDLAVVVSPGVYEAAVARRARGLDPAEFTRIELTGPKDFGTEAWLQLGDAPGRRRDRPGFAAHPGSVAGVAAPHSDAPSGTDLLGITDDVDMLARMVVARATLPPLSIALLGDWGSGKSSFMLQMQQRVAELLAGPRSPRQNSPVHEVRQIEFNAWNYSDDHVWTGLVERLFTVLAADATAADEDVPTPEEMASDRRRLREELGELEAEHASLTRDLAAIEDAPAAGGRLGFLTSPGFVIAVLRALAGEIRRDLRSSRRVLLGVAAAVGVGTVLWWFAGPAASSALTTVVGVVSPLVAAAVVIVGPVWRAYSAASRRAREERDRLVERRDATEQRIAELNDRLVYVDAAAALAAFLVDKGASYTAHRGLAGKVRDDLHQLAEKFAAARAQWSHESSGPPPPERIILYVDDLDRCPPRRVVEVLAAVHLLLAFPLFVVVVAVDARWLLRSIRSHQQGLSAQATAGVQAAIRSDALVTPIDYLDKIFQIPFFLRPMGARGRAYLEGLLPDGTAGETATPATPATPAVPATASRPGPGGSPGGDRGSAAPSSPETPPEAPDLFAGQPAPPAERPISAGERQFLPMLHTFIGNPRGTKKFVNLYRLIRIGVGEDRLDDFLGTSRGGAPFQAVGLLLAVMVGRPEQAGLLFDILLAGTPSQDLVTFLLLTAEDVRLGPDGERTWEEVAGLRRDIAITVAGIRDTMEVVTTLEEYQRWWPEVSRFTFWRSGS